MIRPFDFDGILDEFRALPFIGLLICALALTGRYRRKRRHNGVFCGADSAPITAAVSIRLVNSSWMLIIVTRR